MGKKEKKTETEDIVMDDVEVRSSIVDRVDGSVKKEGRDCHSSRRPFPVGATPCAEKAAQEAAQDYKKRWVHDRVFIFTSASKARQVKRGVKEVVKGVRKGEKGYAP